MSPTGPKYPGTAADGGGTKPWTSVNNAKVEDASVATSDVIGPGGGGGFSNQLELSNFGFSLPSTAVIEGIKLEAKVQSFATGVTDSDIHLETIGGVITSTAQALGYGDNSWPTASLSWISWGGPNTLWGRTWTAAEINSSSFLASISGHPSTGTGTITMDSVRVTVYWRTAPADVPKRYLYKSYNASRQFLGSIPGVVSEFNLNQDISSAGSQITIDVAASLDTSSQAGEVYYTEDGSAPYTNEAGTDNYTTEGMIPIVSAGDSGYDTLIKNGNRIVVWEYSYYYPNGKAMFSGRINKWIAKFGGDSADDLIRVLVYHDGTDLDNKFARGAPFSYTDDQSQTTSDTTYVLITEEASFSQSGQSFQTGAAVTNVGAITLLLDGIANVTVSLWDGPSQLNLLGQVTQYVSVAGPTIVQFGFPVPIQVSSSTSYFFSVSTDIHQSIFIYYKNSNVYANGTRYTATFAGSGGGSFGVDTGDLYFVTSESDGSTMGTYTTADPSTGMLVPLIDDYRSQGGLINYDVGTIEATGVSVTYTFITNTILEALEKIISISPSGFYYYIDLGTNTLYYQRISTTADYKLTRGKHINSLNMASSIEDVKNWVVFSGGDTGGGVNLYTQYQNAASIALYGARLDRRIDNRVTLQSTADAIGQSEIDQFKDEKYQTEITILDKTMDITLLVPGKTIGFNGYGTFVDTIVAVIVRREYTPSAVTLTLGILPKRLHPTFEKVMRDLIAQQTVANPSAPS